MKILKTVLPIAAIVLSIVAIVLSSIALAKKDETGEKYKALSVSDINLSVHGDPTDMNLCLTVHPYYDFDLADGDRQVFDDLSDVLFYAVYFEADMPDMSEKPGSGVYEKFSYSLNGKKYSVGALSNMLIITVDGEEHAYYSTATEKVASVIGTKLSELEEEYDSVHPET